MCVTGSWSRKCKERGRRASVCTSEHVYIHVYTHVYMRTPTVETPAGDRTQVEAHGASCRGLCADGTPEITSQVGQGGLNVPQKFMSGERS